MTYAEAIRLGYVPGDITLQRGYVSRRENLDLALVHVAGTRGSRVGQLYVLAPYALSTQYCKRIYLVWSGPGPEPKDRPRARRKKEIVK